MPRPKGAKNKPKPQSQKSEAEEAFGPVIKKSKEQVHPKFHKFLGER